jgi:hypothetical protein
VTVRTRVPVELETYLDALTEALTSAAELDALYLVGSAALGTYEHGTSDVDVIAAEQHAIALVGPPWNDTFDPVTREAVLEALDESLELIGALNMARAGAWLETGEWVSKPAAESWLRDRVRAELEELR